eukprot:328899-Amphidinium_carterae.1
MLAPSSNCKKNRIQFQLLSYFNIQSIVQDSFPGSFPLLAAKKRHLFAENRGSWAGIEEGPSSGCSRLTPTVNATLLSLCVRLPLPKVLPT